MVFFFILAYRQKSSRIDANIFMKKIKNFILKSIGKLVHVNEMNSAALREKNSTTVTSGKTASS